LHSRQFDFTPTSWSLCFSEVLDLRLAQSVHGAFTREAGMRLLSDESGATKTGCSIITGGMSFAVAVVALPQGATFTWLVESRSSSTRAPFHAPRHGDLACILSSAIWVSITDHDGAALYADAHVGFISDGRDQRFVEVLRLIGRV
jgi:hypothetical protein